MSENTGIVKYESPQGEVQLSLETVKKYLARGDQALTDSEAMMFIKLCQYQKLNPFTNEAYAIKFSGKFQIITGYDTFKRRADAHPHYYGRKSGITVMRGNDVVQKEGTCVYPTETLLGGWCRVYRKRGESEIEEVFREVSMAEYSKGQSTWKAMPATMINKVAVSQALRDAFPLEYAGLYSDAELSPEPVDVKIPANGTVSAESEVVLHIVSKEERQSLFAKAHELFGEEIGNDLVKKLLAEHGLESTAHLTIEVLEKILERLDIMGEEAPVQENEELVSTVV